MITCFFALHCIVDLCNSKVGLIFSLKSILGPKPKQPKRLKLKQLLRKILGNSLLSHDGSLYCMLCKVGVTCDKKFNIKSHRKSANHCKYISVAPTQPKHFTDQGTDFFTKKVTEPFLSADIHLYKLRNQHIIDLFKSMNHPLPSESTYRNQIEKMHSNLINKIKKLSKAKIFSLFLMRPV